MVKPSGADYLAVFQNSRTAFVDPQLQRAQPARNQLGLPKLMSGNFAVVCHLSGPDGTWAVRAFVHDVPDLQYRYQLISSCLDAKRGEASIFVGFRYVPDGIRVNGQIHPIVVMDWVPGIQLHRAVDQRISAGHEISPLIDGWLRLVTELETLQVAHGDLQHGNILVDDDRFRLVDYDGMFVPGMAGMSFSEQGHANYQHPQRRAHGFNSDLDRFSTLLILTALKALHHDPGLWQSTANDWNSLLFHKQDLEDPAASPLFAELAASGDSEVRLLIEAMRDSLLSGEQPPPISHVLGSRSTVIRSTTSTTGWWKTSQAASSPGESSASPLHQHPAIGAGWIRAYVGSTIGVPSDDSITDQSRSQQQSSLLEQVPFVASFNRHFVHRSTCDWAKQISTRNLIGFATLDQAYASGYKPCKTCTPHLFQPSFFSTERNAEVPESISGDVPLTKSAVMWDTSKAREHIQSTSSPATASFARPSNKTLVVDVGSQVKLRYPNGDIVVIRVVRDRGAASTLSHVSIDSPLGAAIKGKRSGDDVVYREMGKTFKFTISDVI